MIAEKFKARFALADSLANLKAIGSEITPAMKKEMTPEDKADVRWCYEQHLTRIKGLVLDPNHREPAIT